MSTTEVLRYRVVVDAKGAKGSFKKLEKQGTASSAAMTGAFAGMVAKINPALLAVAAATGAFVALGKAIKTSAKAYSSFEASMANVSTLVDTTIVDMAGLEKQIRAIHPSLGKAADLTDALYQAISGGVEASKAVDFVAISAKAAKAGLSDTFTAVDVGTTIMNSFGKSTEDAMDIFDQMFVAVKAGKTTFGELASSLGKVAPLASEAGLSSETLLAATAALTTTGQKTSESITSLKAALSNIIKPGAKAHEIATSLELEFGAAALKAKGLKKFMDDLQVATKGNTETMARMFGSTEALNSMLFLTGRGAEKFDQILQDMEKASGETEVAFDKQMQTMATATETLENALNKLAITFGEKIAPGLTVLINKLTEFILMIEKFIGGMGEMGEKVKNVFRTEGQITTSKNLKNIQLEGEELQNLISLMEEYQKRLAYIAQVQLNKGTFRDGISGRIAERTIAKQTPFVEELEQKAHEQFGVKLNLKGEINWGGSEITFQRLIDKLQKEAAQGVTVEFKGEGSTVKPLSEKVDEMTGLLDGFGNTVDKAKPEFKVGFQDVAGTSLSAAMNATERSFGSMFDSLVDGTIDVNKSFADMAVGILKSIGDMLASKAISSFVGMLGSSLGGAFGLTGFAAGGTTPGGRPILVGERGPEIITPSGPSRIIPNHKLGGGGGGGSINVVNNINVGSGSTGDAEGDRRLANDIARSIDEKIKMQIANQMRPGGLLNQTQRLGAYA